MKSKLMLLVALSALSVCAPRSAFSQAAQVGGVGNDGGTTSPGANTALNFDAQKALLNSEYNARYYQVTRQNILYRLSSNQITVASNDTTKQAVGTGGNGARFLNGFYNPLGSRYAAVIVDAAATYISGTPTPLLYNFLCGQNWTSAATGNVRSGLLGQAAVGTAMVPQVQVLLAATPVIMTTMIEHGVLGGPSVIATGAAATTITDSIDGKIIVPPGCAFGIVAQLIGTSHVLDTHLSWYEIKYP